MGVGSGGEDTLVEVDWVGWFWGSVWACWGWVRRRYDSSTWFRVSDAALEVEEERRFTIDTKGCGGGLVGGR